MTWWLPHSPVCDKDGIIADGAIRSGKSICISLSFVIWAMENFNGCNFGMCGKTIGSFRRNVVFWLKLMLKGRGYSVRDHRADNMLFISNGKSENYFYIFGGKDERSQDLIQGITLAGCLFDEVALMPQSFVNQATARCSVEGSKYWFNCNPDGPFHWFKQEWIDKADNKNLLYLHFDMDDNLSLSEKIKERYRSQWSGVFYRRYILGEWAVAEGVIYDMFDTQKHTFSAVSEPLKNIRYVSVDYGTLNPTVFLLWEQGFSGTWYCTKEYYYSGREKSRQKTDSEYADDFISFANGLKITEAIVDPSAASFIAELRKRNVLVRKADNDVLNGIRLVGNHLNNDVIKISSSCINTIKEFSSYVWDEKAAMHGEDKPVKENDHSMDSIRYFCKTIIKNKATGFVKLRR